VTATVIPATTTATPVLLAAGPTAPGYARLHVRRQLATWRLDHLTEDACLIVSELVTNAVVANTGPEVAVEIGHTDECVVIRVGDDSPVPPTPRFTGPLSESGHGLMLVACLARRWGWELSDDDGMTVWAEIT
jgi:anti-sigma regulatory factor (Ser/Thr protein kinase)